jgi:hypothetical protein
MDAAQFVVVTHSGGGKLVERSEQTAAWLLPIPDNVKDKTAQSAADIWRSAAVSLKAGRKEKAPAPIRLSELYAIIPGQAPGLSMARFVTDVSFHTYPTVGAGAAFRQTLELIRPAVKKYLSGLATESTIFGVKCADTCSNGRTATLRYPRSRTGLLLTIAVKPGAHLRISLH